MSKTWVISDHHFHHANILTFTGDDGKLIRPGFQSVQDMNEFMVEKWNSVVGGDDKVYVAGDIVIRTSAWAFEILSELRGRKVLIKGNHDEAKLSIYSRYFLDVRSEKQFKVGKGGPHVIISHRPLRLPDNTYNIHGHIHQNVIDDPRYINVSVEVVDYTPVSLDDIKKYIMTQEEMQWQKK